VYWKKFTLTHRDVIECGRFPFHVLIWGEPREVFEIMDEMRLIVVSPFQGDPVPGDESILFEGTDCLLEAHDLKVLLGRQAYLPPEEVDEVLLRISDFIAQLIKTPNGWLMDNA
jgi:hypothetical protein